MRLPWPPRLVFAVAVCAANVDFAASGDSGGSRPADGHGSCASEHSRASPVDIVPSRAVPVDGFLRLHYEGWNRSNTTMTRSQGAGSFQLDFRGVSGGFIQVGTRFNDLDEYVLRSIVVRAPSEHTFLGRRMPVEVQLMHEPIVQFELEQLQEKRREAREMLQALQKEAKVWGQQMAQLQNNEEENHTFPDIQTLNDWVALMRNRLSEHGGKISRRARDIRDLMASMDEKMERTVAILKRPESTRIIGLSVFLKASDIESPQQSQASAFTRWLDAAADEVEDNGQANSSKFSQLSKEVPDSFNFARLPYQGTKDIGGGVIHQVFTYQGRFTRPPCTPVVKWFMASEPLTAYGANLAQLVNRTRPPAAVAGAALLATACGGGPACELGLGAGVWWDGPLKDTQAAQPTLGMPPELHSVLLSTDPFVAPARAVGGDALAGMPWSFVNWYCFVFLFFGILMMCATGVMWTQSCCDP